MHVSCVSMYLCAVFIHGQKCCVMHVHCASMYLCAVFLHGQKCCVMHVRCASMYLCAVFIHGQKCCVMHVRCASMQHTSCFMLHAVLCCAALQTGVDRLVVEQLESANPMPPCKLQLSMQVLGLDFSQDQLLVYDGTQAVLYTVSGLIHRGGS